MRSSWRKTSKREDTFKRISENQSGKSPLIQGGGPECKSESSKMGRGRKGRGAIGGR